MSRCQKNLNLCELKWFIQKYSLLLNTNGNIVFFLVHEGLICPELIVTGDDWASVTGTYVISDETASKAPERPVYKLVGQDRYVYFNPGGAGWRIGTKKRLSGETEGWYMYQSKSFF